MSSDESASEVLQKPVDEVDVEVKQCPACESEGCDTCDGFGHVRVVSES